MKCVACPTEITNDLHISKFKDYVRYHCSTCDAVFIHIPKKEFIMELPSFHNGTCNVSPSVEGLIVTSNTVQFACIYGNRDKRDHYRFRFSPKSYTRPKIRFILDRYPRRPDTRPEISAPMEYPGFVCSIGTIIILRDVFISGEKPYEVLKVGKDMTTDDDVEVALITEI